MAPVPDSPPRREAYVLHMWEERIGLVTIWRFRVVKAQTGETVAFAGGKAVLRYLRSIFASGSDSDSAPARSRWVSGVIQRVNSSMRGLTDAELTAAAAGSAPPDNPVPDADADVEPPIA